VALRAEDIDLDRDRALVEAWQGGDAAAFDELYLHYFDRLRRYCERRVGDRVEAEEIAQEAFTRALQALPRFSGERRFYPWMTVIAGRLCIDHHRRRARVEPSDEVDTGLVEDGHDERLALRADLASLERALHRLGPRHREVLDLREREGLSYHEIAGTLGVPHSTVETLLFRARRALRKEFHRVSADRLAGVPLLGAMLGRVARLRSRLTESSIELATIGAPIAAGAMSVLLTLPSGAAPTATPHLQPISSRGVPAATTTPLGDAPPVLSAPTPRAIGAGSGRPAASPPAAIPGVTPMSADAAEHEAAHMPVHLELADLGAGLDVAPAISGLTPPSEGKNP
jgi:RNA polymerase sigma-70 factor (ECF subfamily)